jgi:hypothetical protein
LSSAKEQFRAQIRKDTLQDNKNHLYKKADGPQVLRRDSIDMKPFKKMRESHQKQNQFNKRLTKSVDYAHVRGNSPLINLFKEHHQQEDKRKQVFKSYANDLKSDIEKIKNDRQ